MAPSLFISYRRTDTQQAALGLYAQLRSRFGSGHVFMDRSGIGAGDIWPDRLRQSMDRAAVVIALIGPDWLRAADHYGRRRLDLPNDWVRSELAAAIEAGKRIVPILLGSDVKMPPAEALPEHLIGLADYQAYSLREDHWDADLNELVRLLTDNHGFKDGEKKIQFPVPEVNIDPLTPAELDEHLRFLVGWEPVETMIPGDYPKSRLELRKVYGFKTFRAAVRFMSSAIDPIDAIQHHPRWENQWRFVTVYTSTWDLGFRISKLDLDLARLLDSLYNDQSLRRTLPVASS